jgi:tetratricopeptide (TPR) repeat protein
MVSETLTSNLHMKRFAFSFFIFVIAAAVTSAQPNIEANKIARDASEAAKNQDWDTAIDGFRKAAAMDKKYENNLAAALQQRAADATKQNRFPDAITDLGEAIKIHPNAAAFELRAFVYMRMNDSDHAIADYTEAIKESPNESRLYLRRADMLAAKNDFKGVIADCDKALKMKRGDEHAHALKKWAEERMKAAAGQAPNNAPPPPSR